MKKKNNYAGKSGWWHGKTARTIRKILLWTAVALLVLPVIGVLIYKWAPVKWTPLMVQRYFEGEPRSKNATQQWVDYADISPQLTRAVISSEDNLFAKHWGFSFPSIKAAWKGNREGKPFRGGSTISQQCAKNVFLFHTRSYLRKAYEAYFTLLIELIWGKERIMEVYLNVIEMGPGVYGAEAASQKYFRHSAKNITQAEAALIAACLPNPRRYLVAAPSQYVLGRQQTIMGLMPKMGKIELK
ncbi:MAG: monofunctional biosynthetic peptidoglycan transglycosylase [Bacteroidales bacterium]|nr:monofunctional biosynthetic peptidoglycan transglycosylase [Bacteroidales bacterium]